MFSPNKGEGGKIPLFFDKAEEFLGTASFIFLSLMIGVFQFLMYFIMGVGFFLWFIVEYIKESIKESIKGRK